jgi:hypothetical protein
LTGFNDLLLPVCGLPAVVSLMRERHGRLTVYNTLITLCIVTHPGEYRLGRFTLRSDNHQSHLSIHRYQWLIHKYISADMSVCYRYLSWLDQTYSGNLPLTLATYCFFTVPSLNSSANLPEAFPVKPMIINPDVNRSSRLTA